MNRFVLPFFLLFFATGLSAQAPSGFKFQAVARDVDNNAMATDNIAVRVSLLRGGPSGTVDYSERHEVTTTDLGVFDLHIGNGAGLSGDMATIDWGADNYFLKVDIDPDGGDSYINLGASQLLSVPYAMYANSAGSGGGGGDPTDELQNLIYDPATQTLTLTDGNSVTLQAGGGGTGTDDQTITLSGTTLSIEGGNDVDLSALQDGVDDADADPTNEIQDITFDATTNQLSITDGSTVTLPSGGTDADADPTNEIQDITFDATTNQLSITDGSTVTLPSGGTDADADPTNEIQTLNFNAATNELSIDGGNTVTIPSGGTDADADPTNEIQTITISGDQLSLSGGGGTVTIPAGSGGTDEQTLTFDPATNALTISGGNTITIPTGGADADADPMNEIQTVTISGTTITLSDGGGSLDLAPIIAAIDTDDADADPANEIQSLTFNASTNELSIDGGNTVTIPTGGTDADADPTNEIQALTLAGSTLSLSNGGGTVNLPAGTDEQTLLFNNLTKELTISGGNSITLDVSDGDANPANELQAISISGNVITLSQGGGNLDLAPIIAAIDTDDADADPANELQNLSLSGTVLELTDGGSVDLRTLGGTSPWETIDGGLGQPALGINYDGGNVTVGDALANRTMVIKDEDNTRLVIEAADNGNSKAGIALRGFQGIDSYQGWLWEADHTNISKPSLRLFDYDYLVASPDNENREELYSLSRRPTFIGNGSIYEHRWSGFAKMGSYLSLEGRGNNRSLLEFFPVAIANKAKTMNLSSRYNETDLYTRFELYNNEYDTSKVINLFEPASLYTADRFDGGFNLHTFTGRVKLNSNDQDFASGASLDLDLRTFSADHFIGLKSSKNVVGDAVFNLSETLIGDNGTGASSNPLYQITSNPLYSPIGLGGSHWLYGNTQTNQLYVGDENFDLRGQANDAKVTINNNDDEQMGLHIDAAGRVNVPAAAIHSREASGRAIETLGTVKIEASNNLLRPGLQIVETGTDASRIQFSREGAPSVWQMAARLRDTPTSSDINFSFRGTGGASDRMTITGDGKVGINGTPTARLHILQRGQTVGNGLRFTDGTANLDWNITHGFGLRFHYGGNFRALINANSGSYMQASDKRLKDNINLLSPVLNKVKQIAVKTYHYKSDESQEGSIGVIAQEAKELFPELVTYSKADELYGVDYAGFSMVAIKAVQEQQSEIEALKNKNNTLEARLARLEALLLAGEKE